MDYMRVCAIDAGTRNFAWCIVDNNNWRDPLHWQREDLWVPRAGRRGTPTKDDIIDITVKWVNAHRALLDTCDLVVLERQMRVPYIIMNTVIHTSFYGKCEQVHPMTVGSFWKLPKKREAKKRAGVAVAQHFAEIPRAVKTDDLADAWLMAVYYLVQRKAISAMETII